MMARVTGSGCVVLCNLKNTQDIIRGGRRSCKEAEQTPKEL